MVGLHPHPVKQEYSRLADHYDHRWGRYIRATADRTARSVSIRPGDRVLDVGCGTGVLLASIGAATPGATLVGLDLSQEMLQVAKRRLPASATLVTADAQALPFGDEAFDVVVTSSSLHHWADPATGLSEIRRVLVPGGTFVVTDWCDDYLMCKVCFFALWLLRRVHHRVYGFSECRAATEDAGFVVRAAEKYKVGWLWGLMTLRATKAAT